MSSTPLSPVLSSTHAAPCARVRVTTRVIVATAASPAVGGAMTTMVPPPSCPINITVSRDVVNLMDGQLYGAVKSH